MTTIIFRDKKTPQRYAPQYASDSSKRGGQKPQKNNNKSHGETSKTESERKGWELSPRGRYKEK